MTAKNSTDRHKKFLKDGFFAPELPPAFHSVDLATKRSALKKAFVNAPKIKGKSAIDCYTSKPTIFRFPRYQNSDRRHSVVNPIGFFALSEVISDEYVELRKIAKKSHISATPPMFDWDGTRAVKRPSFEVKDQFSEFLAANYEYTATTDISAFYHSIYTHSIPWAIHGKEFSKKNKTNFSLLGNRIDRLVRNAQDGQTIGLPVGPDTSRLVAELVASAIDCSIQTSLKKMKIRGLRLVDDFIVGCATRAEAEKLIAIVRRSTNSFELELNNHKSVVQENFKREEPGWKEAIKKQIPIKPYTIDDMRRFFFNTEQIQKELPHHNILKFAFGNARSAFVHADEWKPVQRYLVAAYKQNSTLIGLLVEILIQRQKLKKDLEIVELTTFLKTRLPILGEQLRNGEASWLLYLAKVLLIELPARVLEPYYSEQDSLTSLQIADAEKAGLISGKVDFNCWNSCLSKDQLDSEMWLYAYESTLKLTNKSSAGQKFIEQHDFFGPLLKNNVSFYDTEKFQPEFKERMKALKHENLWNKKIAASFGDDFEWENEEDEFDDFDAIEADDFY